MPMYIPTVTTTGRRSNTPLSKECASIVNDFTVIEEVKDLMRGWNNCRKFDLFSSRGTWRPEEGPGPLLRAA